jgi:hypothetical protein
MDAPELSVYGEAKGEYTRQLCVFLVPSLESYFLALLEKAREEAPTPTKVLWHFQSLLQAIPDWNQDKVIRETEALQADCKCDYLEELLTAVFIAHTKVLSAIRLTTKQKKLQITIPKLDHFLHRLLSECARSLWTNAYLFADTNAIEKQKNLRQVAALLQEAVLQAIRGLLPVKSILREYLHEEDDGEGEGETAEESTATASGQTTAVTPVAEEEAETEAEKSEEAPVPTPESVKEEVKVVEAPKVASMEDVETFPVIDLSGAAPTPAVAVAEPEPEPEPAPAQAPPQTIVIETKPTVSFAQEHVFFDSDKLEENEITDIPFAEAENRLPEEEDEDDFEDEQIQISDETLPMDADEVLA